MDSETGFRNPVPQFVLTSFQVPHIPIWLRALQSDSTDRTEHPIITEMSTEQGWCRYL